jgi:4a-hydroxytetrahydrobiopterin dehydratase
MNELARKKCRPCEGGIAPLDAGQVAPLLKGLDGWALEGKTIVKTYRFAGFHETMAFVNAAAWVSHREDHHPDMLVRYNQCRVAYTTHAIDGLSENDFICAAKLDALLEI